MEEDVIGPNCIELVCEKPSHNYQLIRDRLIRRNTSRKEVQLGTWGWLKDRFRYLDIFGTAVNFTYDSDEVYKTHEGATVTVLIVLTLLIVTGT